MAEFRWMDATVDELIALYQANSCLYDTKSKDYSNRDRRKKAVQEIATALGCSGK